MHLIHQQISKRLSELDLSRVPRLTTLECSHNDITELDLSHVPRLTTLECFCRSLTELDVTPLHSLKDLGYHKETTQLIQRPDQNF